MAFVTDVIQRTSRVLPSTQAAHWLLRLPLALVLLQYGFDKFPLSADVAAGWGLPVSLWAIAGGAEILAGVALIGGGALLSALAGALLTPQSGAWPLVAIQLISAIGAWVSIRLVIARARRLQAA